MARDIFDKPFDDGTLIKLKIFEDYLKEWLPVFISKPNPIWKEIQIFDLFAGAGKDINGVNGSPLRILTTLNQNVASLSISKVKVKVIFNEYDVNKYQSLKTAVDSLANRSVYDVVTHNSDFAVIFNEYYDSMKSAANFLFLDQNGIKQITLDIFRRLIKLQQTDFLFFISSSYIKRFAEVEEFNKYLRITSQELAGKSYYHIHRIVLNYYRNSIPANHPYFLAPFSIKKPSGIYGLIFGSNHSYGIEKFLNVSWKHDTLTGEANFDIDNEKIDLRQPSLFEIHNIPSKRQLFESNLKAGILTGKLKSNVDVYKYSLLEGFLPKDANTILKELKQHALISFDFKLVSSKIHNESSAPIKIL
jgi:three-Cys-motif partner protein